MGLIIRVLIGGRIVFDAWACGCLGGMGLVRGVALSGSMQEQSVARENA